MTTIPERDRVLQLMRGGYSVGQVADKTGLSTVEVRETIAAAQLAATQKPTPPRTVTPPARPAGVPGPPPAPSQPNRHDQLIDRARQVPKLAKLVEKHDQLIEKIAERLQVDEAAARAERQRQMAIEQARAAAEKARRELADAQAKLRELGGPTKPKRQLSEAQLTSLRANAEKARGAAAAKRAGADA